MLTTLIIDDEPFAHDVVLHHLAQHTDFKNIHQCYNATEALSWLANNHVDLLFLDINMPELNGIECLKVLRNRPQVIIISAYQEFALQGFDLDVTDYLLKPVCEQRFSQSLDKVRFKAEKQRPESTIKKDIVLKVDREKRKFKINDISLLEAYGNYVKLWKMDEVILVNSSLKLILEQLPSGQFIQVHKSFVVNNKQVVQVETNALTMQSGRTIKLTKSFKVNAKKLLS